MGHPDLGALVPPPYMAMPSVLLLALVTATIPIHAMGLTHDGRDSEYEAPMGIGQANSIGGLKLALTQSFLDYAVSVAKPTALEFLKEFAFPDPLVKGDDYTCSWSIGGLKLSNVDADLALTLVSPGSLSVSISNLQLSLSATVQAREDVWPNPSLSIGVAGDADGSSARATVAVQTDGRGVPSLSMSDCSPHVVANNIHVTGGLIWPFDQLGDLLIGNFKDSIIGSLGPMICNTGIRDTLLNIFLNPFLTSWSYLIPIPFPAPYDRAVLDYHLSGTPSVVSLGYLEAAAHARVDVNGVKSLSPMPVMPSLTSAQIGTHMITAQLSPYVLNTAFWGFFQQHLVGTTITKAMVPQALQFLFNTDAFPLLPKLQKAYPHSEMLVNLSATSIPTVSIAVSGVTATLDAKATFLVAPSATRGAPLPAFDLRAPALKATVKIGATGGDSPAITGSIGTVNLELKAGSSSFGDLGPAVIAFLSKPLNEVLNSVAIPLVNDVIKSGIPIPNIDQTVDGYHIKVAIANPEISPQDGFALVGTDVSASITPAATSIA